MTQWKALAPGNSLANFPLQRETVLARAWSAFQTACARLERPDEVAEPMRREIERYRNLPEDAVAPAPPRPGARVYGAEFLPFAGEHFQLTADPDSPCGYAIRGSLDGNMDKFAFPLLNGVYHRLRKTMVAHRRIQAEEIPGGIGYHWYALGEFDIDRYGCFILTNDWGVHLEFEEVDFSGKAEIWVSMKVAGPAFGKGAPTEASFLWIDRVAIIPVGNVSTGKQ